ncbi:dnaJ homolog subfamily C member 7-like [Palaemon carinicauda]|uniref:dnaJ homolog subfamily C member 7-like n=1 Tax=Palaemon carinicauda TaxID=392227 RepID=UPI0035B62EEE
MFATRRTVENLEDEKSKLQGQLNELRIVVEEINTEKEMQEKLNAQKEIEYQKLKIDCAEKDLQMKEEEKKHAILKMGMEEMKKVNKILNKKIEKLENVCVQKDLQMKIKENLLEILKADNEVQKQKTDQQNQLKKNERSKNEDTKKESKKETENKEENKQKNVLKAEANAASGNPLDMDIILNCCQEFEKCRQECSRAYVLRGKHLLKLGLFDAARKDFETARTVEGFEECSKFIEDAKAQRKKWVDQTHYDILGVSQTATTKEILKGFRVLAMKCHPDRHGGEPKFILDGFEWRFKRVNYAKTVLTDEKLRKSYDVWIRPKSG